ncbi:MAG: hypothetical protein IT176_13135 [Acidobacteria bacterium]|nr:hypothetical protein [Acidobacteriota bacterium]
MILRSLRPPHLREERLFNCYVAGRAGEPIDPRDAEHLADCPACARRHADLARWMDELRSQADADTDDRFTPDVLAAQQHRIAHAIQHVGCAARVIAFPERAATRSGPGVSHRTTPRWLAAAVAAGIIVGLGLGASVQWRSRGRAPAAPSLSDGLRAPEPAPVGPVATSSAGAAFTADDDAFLAELEIALETPQTRVLQPYDAITPHVQEIADIQR